MGALSALDKQKQTESTDLVKLLALTPKAVAALLAPPFC